MKKFISCALILAIAISIVGCDLSNLAPSGKAELSRGNVSGNKYTNEFLGFTFTAPDSWVYSTDEEIAAAMNLGMENFLDENYKKALENRNCILKMMQKGLPIDLRELESWSDSMAEYASYIYLFREDYVSRLTVYAEKILSDISDGGERLSLSYESSIPSGIKDRLTVKEEYKKVLCSSVDREIAAGVTLFGPHRDDLDIQINGKSARSFASQGQQRSIVLALKLSEGEVIKEICGEYPVFLFDDVLSELDERRRKYVLSEIGE